MPLHYGGLIVEDGVEYHIRFLLEGEYPALFAAANARPHRKRALHGGAARFVIAHEAAEYAKIGGADAVMIVKIDGGEG